MFSAAALGVSVIDPHACVAGTVGQALLNIVGAMQPTEATCTHVHMQLIKNRVNWRMETKTCEPDLFMIY